MNDLNSVLVEGNLTRDPLLATTPNGTSVCNFAVGTHHEYKREDQRREETSFFDVEVWAKLGENCAEYLRKGRGVRVVGRLKQDRWKNGEGQPRSRVKIVAEHVDFRPMRKPAAGEEQAAEEAAGEEKAPSLEELEKSGMIKSGRVKGEPEGEAGKTSEIVEALAEI